MEADGEFDDFVRERYEQLLRYALILTGSRWDAEEVVQEALLRCLRRWRRVVADNQMAYARKAVLHEFLRAAARKQWRITPAPERVEDFSPSVAERGDVLAVLRLLPPRQRAAVVARFLFDLSEPQAARELGCTVGTVKSLTSRGLARIRESWGVPPGSALPVGRGRELW
ncbi:sigma-70 family RNA polymerase sigma factor [Crossiella sp. SN42]|uniref:sigma-70 family RNA polymerase sigma factor n=1 Tax=Crossiella sp. SN42 TaxID=2944808 RepID=UPI00207D0E8F|nr:sigma-70 family RNA polymerase sigma factor [Crossiella sp. SN42]MCO1576370.1 sigma-70 family RNA polymerase sigma factor [Crossiella sp. SN42]